MRIRPSNILCDVYINYMTCSIVYEHLQINAQIVSQLLIYTKDVFSNIKIKFKYTCYEFLKKRIILHNVILSF